MMDYDQKLAFTNFPDQETLFGTSGGERITRENWGRVTQGQFSDQELIVPQKRRKTTSVLAKKRAKMTRGDDNLTDEVSKKVAVEIMDQIQDTPGVITLNFGCPQTANLVPIPTEFQQVEKSIWTADSVREGQLSSLLTQEPDKFQNLGVKTVKKGAVETKVHPRQMDMKEALARVNKPDKWTDEFVNFGSGVANVLRRMDVETAERLAESIAVIIGNEVNNANNVDNK